MAGCSAPDVARRLGDEGIAVWDGNFYALGLVERLGLEGSGGLVRLGLTHYNTAAEVDRVVDVLGRIAAEGGGDAAVDAARRAPGIAATR